MFNLNATSTEGGLGQDAMIDNFSLALTHGLMLLVAWRLIFRDDLDREGSPEPDPEPQGWGRKPPGDA